MECLRTHFQRGVVLNGRYETENALNHGSFGMVFVAKDTVTDKQVAVKILTKRSAIPEGENAPFAIDDAREELEFHELLGQHRNTVNLIETFETDNHVYLVLEYCEHGDLYEAIRTGMGPIGVAEVKDFMLQLVDGIEYMHSKGLYHRDIKPENIFLCADGSVKLGDFGLATKTKWCYETTVGSDRYMAPEQYDSAGDGYNPAQADLWAIGVILLNVLFSKNPFIKPTLEDPIFLDYSRDSQSLFDVFTDMSQDTFDVILASMSLDPKKRSLTAIRDALNRVEAFTDGFDDNDDYCRPTIRPPPIVTANREPLRTPTIKSATVENGVAFPWQKALEATPAQAIRQLSTIQEPDNLGISYSEDLFAQSAERDWSYVRVATPSTSMAESSLGQSLFSNYHAPTSRPMLKKLPSLLPISGSLPINMVKSKAMASVFGKKETIAKSWSDMWDDDMEEEEEDVLMDRKMLNNARTFSNEKMEVDSDENAVVFEEDEEAVVLSVKKPSDVNIQKVTVRPQAEAHQDDFRFDEIDDENAIDAFFYQSKPKPICPMKADKAAPAIYSPPAKRTSDATDKWAALGARRRGLTGESMAKAPTSWRITKNNVGMKDGNGFGSFNAGVWDQKPAATGGAHYNNNNNHNKAKKGWVHMLDQQHHQSPINFSRNNKFLCPRAARNEQENVDHTARDMHQLDGDVGDLEWVGGWGDKVAGLQL